MRRIAIVMVLLAIGCGDNAAKDAEIRELKGENAQLRAALKGDIGQLRKLNEELEVVTGLFNAANRHVRRENKDNTTLRLEINRILGELQECGQEGRRLKDSLRHIYRLDDDEANGPIIDLNPKTRDTGRAVTTRGPTVYITMSGSKYHGGGCSYLRRGRMAKSLSRAKAEGYSACSRCGGR